MDFVQRINAKDSGQRVKDFHFAKDSGIKNGDESDFYLIDNERKTR